MAVGVKHLKLTIFTTHQVHDYVVKLKPIVKALRKIESKQSLTIKLPIDYFNNKNY